MSDELIALQETATQARAKAEELKAALTDASTDEERAAAVQADTDALTAESAFADAKAKADADAGGTQGGDAPKVGDACTTDGGDAGTMQDPNGDGALVCVITPAPANDEKKEEVDENQSRTDFVEGPVRTGDACVCPDGRDGTVTVFAGNMAVCLPNQG